MALAQVVGNPDLLANILARLLNDEDGGLDKLALSDLHSVYRTSRAFRDGMMALLRRAEQEGGPNKWLSCIALCTWFESPLEAYAMLATMAPHVTKMSVYAREETRGIEHDTLCNRFLNSKLSSFRQLRFLELKQEGRFDTVHRPWILSALPALHNLVDIELSLLDGAGKTWQCFQRVMAEESLPVTHLRVRFRAHSYHEYYFNWPNSKLHTLHISFTSRPNHACRDCPLPWMPYI